MQRFITFVTISIVFFLFVNESVLATFGACGDFGGGFKPPSGGGEKCDKPKPAPAPPVPPPSYPSWPSFPGFPSIPNFWDSFKKNCPFGGSETTPTTPTTKTSTTTTTTTTTTTPTTTKTSTTTTPTTPTTKTTTPTTPTTPTTTPTTPTTPSTAATSKAAPTMQPSTAKPSTPEPSTLPPTTANPCTQCTLDTIALTKGSAANATSTPITLGVEMGDDGCSILRVNCTAPPTGIAFMQYNEQQGGPNQAVGNPVVATLHCKGGLWYYVPGDGLPDRWIQEVDCQVQADAGLGGSTAAAVINN